MISELFKYSHKIIWWVQDIRNIKEKIRQCGTKPLTSAQKREIQSFWRPLVGHRVPTYWHEYFLTRNGVFSPRYVPTAVYHYDIIFRLNFRPFAKAYANKSFYDTIFPDVLRPQTIIKCINGFYYDEKQAISRKEAMDRCRNLTDVVVKPSQDGMWGRGVRIFSTVNGMVGETETLASMLDAYGPNFIVQEKVVQHERMSALNPSSLNTLRILSYRQGDEIVILYAVVRIGRRGQSIDNETAGGVNADIDLTTGCIRDCAYGTPAEKRILRTDIGTELSGYFIPSFHGAIDLVKELHLRLPYFKLVGWDIGIDVAGRPIMIEWNRAPDLSQTAHGPAFGDMTEEIVREALKYPDSFMLLN